LRWVRLPGALGAATGAIAIGTAATSTSITTTILTGTPTEPLTGTSIAVLVLAKAIGGSTTRNIAGMHLMGTGKRRISSGVRVLVAQAALVIARVGSGEPVVRAGLVELAA
jgi:hypothetical protein